MKKLENFTKYIEKPEEQLEVERLHRVAVRPYWDPTLRRDRWKRFELYRVLQERGILSFRRRVEAKVSMFFVWKIEGRLHTHDRGCTSREYSCYRLPLRVALGSAGAISEFGLTGESLKKAAAELNEDELRQLLADCGEVGMTSVSGAGADVSDAFHQFAVDEVADFFGLDDPMPAGYYWGVDCVFVSPGCPSSPVRPEELLYPVLHTMCMGWSWALYFCQGAIRSFISAGAFRLGSGCPCGRSTPLRRSRLASQ